ncbi:hypothetical protein PODOV073v1_p0041 [Vibrio phage PS25B.1]|nr:hypothetical protein PODOV073v1_p0041 [Vibrio phage PS25B.1]
MILLFNITYTSVVLVMFGASLYLTWEYIKEIIKDYDYD